jgi:hypothetical protein
MRLVVVGKRHGNFLQCFALSQILLSKNKIRKRSKNRSVGMLWMILPNVWCGSDAPLQFHIFVSTLRKVS